MTGEGNHSATAVADNAAMDLDLPVFAWFGVAVAVMIVIGVLSAGSKLAAAERKRADEESRTRAVRGERRGWRYDPTPQGDIRYRFYGTTAGGSDWALEYDSDHSSSSSSPKLVFRVSMVATGEHAWAIFDRGAYDLVRSGVGKVVIGGLASLISLASDRMAKKRDFFYAASEVDTGISEWKKRYVLLAHAGQFKTLVDRSTARRILQWPAFKPSMSRRDNCFGAGCDPQGVEVHLYADGPSFEVIEHLVSIGETLADRTRSEFGGEST